MTWTFSDAQRIFFFSPLKSSHFSRLHFSVVLLGFFPLSVFQAQGMSFQYVVSSDFSFQESFLEFSVFNLVTSFGFLL